MNNIFNDFDLSDLFNKTVSDDYRTAIEFLNDYPDYSLLKFREIITSLCHELAQKHQVVLKNEKLADHIDELFNKKIIDKRLKDNFHKVRIHGNSGVHKHNIINGITHPDSLKDRWETIKQKAKDARKLVIDIFKECHFINTNNRIQHTEYIVVNDQSYKNILFDAATTWNDHRLKLKAGILYEAIARGHSAPPFSTVPHDYILHNESLYKLAASHYEASYKISSNIDQNFIRSTTRGLSQEDIIHKYCQLEPLYRYAALAMDNLTGEKNTDKGCALMKIAADRGYGPAEADYGAYLYEKKEYGTAKKYLDRAFEKDELTSIRFLHFYFSDGLACDIDRELSIKYLERGISLGCPDSLALLGQAHHKGVLVEKDDKKAEELLNEAMDAGSIIAQHYYHFEFNDLPEKMAQRFALFAKMLEATQNPNSQKIIRKPAKIGPNEKCHCGSGKKYKKCCRDRDAM